MTDVVVMDASPTAMDHWRRDMQSWWGRRHLCEIDTRTEEMNR